jgi:NTE family protein
MYPGKISEVLLCAQQKRNSNTGGQAMQFDMVFEGGGAKGMAFVGALKALEEKGHTSRRLIGTSAGAITATLLAVGYNAQKMEEELGRKDSNGIPVFAKFMDTPTAKDLQGDIDSSLTMQLFKNIDFSSVLNSLSPLLRPLSSALTQFKAQFARKLIEQLLKSQAYATTFSFVEQGGLYVGQEFFNWFRERLNGQKPGFADLTLAQLFTATTEDLSLVATDTTDRAMLVLNHRTAPNCPVTWAVRMSMSIPFAWHEVRWQPEWNPYCLLDESGTVVKTQKNLTDHAIVDGGVLSNFPINLLASNEPAVRACMGNTVADRTTVLGLLIDEEREVKNAPPPPKVEEDDEKGIKGNIKKLRTVTRVSRLLDTMMAAHDKQTIAANEDLICRIPAKTYGTMEFDMTDDRKKALIEAAEATMLEHLAHR